MELPKNITQIGEVNRFCKIYVEDYVISYLKQLNQAAVSKDIAVALYGIRQEEGDVIYLFLYGACQLDFLQRETRHLSQAQQQEIERLRRKYFADYGFQGYRLLNGEMIEGFHVYEQGICRYIAGYAQFYEKNDSMLAYMLDARGHEPAPEVVDQEKYETVKRRQEARKVQAEEAKRGENKNPAGSKNSGRNGSKNSSKSGSRDGNKNGNKNGSKNSSKNALESRRIQGNKDDAGGMSQGGGQGSEGLSEGEREDLTEIWRQDKENSNRENTGLRGMKIASVVVFALLCLAGLSMLDDGERLEELQAAAMNVVAGVTEQKLPDATPQADSNTLITEDKLTEALQKENEMPSGTSPEPAPEPTASAAEPAQVQTPAVAEPAPGQTAASAEPAPGQTAAVTEPAPEPTASAAEPSPKPTAEPAPVSAEVQPISYTIQQGDTLIGISLRNYGNKNRVTDICKLNGITNPDNIREGQKILLPQ